LPPIRPIVSRACKECEHLIALLAIMSEWTSADSYAERMRKIGNGVVGSDGKLPPAVSGWR
jgi:hypothetical protein